MHIEACGKFYQTLRPTSPLWLVGNFLLAPVIFFIHKYILPLKVPGTLPFFLWQVFQSYVCGSKMNHLLAPLSQWINWASFPLGTQKGVLGWAPQKEAESETWWFTECSQENGDEGKGEERSWATMWWKLGSGFSLTPRSSRAWSVPELISPGGKGPASALHAHQSQVMARWGRKKRFPFDQGHSSLGKEDLWAFSSQHAQYPAVWGTGS